MPRYVILKHEMPAGHPRPTHWDLMLEVEGALATWALAEMPVPGREIAAQQLADHRLAYLEYEGPISGDRGTVSQWDAGEYQPMLMEPARWEVALAGRQLRGRLTITQTADAKGWITTFE